MSVYGSPFDRQRTVSRWFRRGASGLLAGRSEAARAVALPSGRAAAGDGRPGRDGGNGLPGVAGMSKGFKMWTKVGGSVTFQSPPSFGMSWASLSSDVAPVVSTDDMNGLPTGSISGGLNVNEHRSVSPEKWFQVGQGNGRGGGLAVFQFGFSAIPSSRRWFVGFSTEGNVVANSITPPPTSINVEPSSFTQMIGVGQDSSDTSPQFMFNDGSGSASKVSTGLSTVATLKLYEVSVFADPFGTGVDITFKRYDGGIVTSSVTHHASTNLPSVLTAPWIMLNVGPVAGSLVMRFLSFYGEVQPWP